MKKDSKFKLLNSKKIERKTEGRHLNDFTKSAAFLMRRDFSKDRFFRKALKGHQKTKSVLVRFKEYGTRTGKAVQVYTPGTQDSDFHDDIAEVSSGSEESLDFLRKQVKSAMELENPENQFENALSFNKDLSIEYSKHKKSFKRFTNLAFVKSIIMLRFQ